MTAEPRQFDVIVLGAGAAGLICAATAGQRGRRVVVLEHNGQVGRKILISGGGRCNFTNLHCGPENFISNNPHFPKSALALYQPRHFIELVDRYGIPWREKTLGQLFCDGSARAIVEMLLAECAAGGVEIVLNSRATCGGANSLRPFECGHPPSHTAGGICATNGGFRVTTSTGEFWAESLVVATGGLSIPKLGATGLGYDLARQFGLAVIEPRPALVPLVLGGDEAGWTKLAGVAADVEAWTEPGTEKHSSEAKARIGSVGIMRGLKPPPPSESKSKALAYQPVPFKEKILVTHRGLSGPAVLQASSYWRPGDALVVDFAPSTAASHLRHKNKDVPKVGHPAAEVHGIIPIRIEREWMEHGAVEEGILNGIKQPGARRDLAAVKQALREALPHRLADYLAEIGGPQGWSNAALEACERELRRWKFHPAGTEGLEKAEVTAGGVDTDELRARTMEARAVPGLYFIGEVVDVTGQLGGFNFQWAWASGVAAGKAC